MAEIIGLAASVAGLLTTAGAGFKIADSMLHMARRIRGATEEIQDFGQDISTFANVLLLAYQSLDPNREGGISSSPALQWIQYHDALSSLVTDSQRVIQHIKELNQLLRSMDSVVQIKLWNRFKWAWKGRDVKALGPKMERLKSSLNLVINIVTLEVAQTKNDAEVVSMLQTQMKIQLQTIQILEERQQRAQPSYSGQVQESYSNQNSSQAGNSVQELLMKLGQSMREHGKVPNIVDEAYSVSSSSYAFQSPNSGHSNYLDSSEQYNNSWTHYTSSKVSIQLNDEADEREASGAFTTSHDFESPIPDTPIEIRPIESRRQKHYPVEIQEVSIRGNPTEIQRVKSQRQNKYPAKTQEVTIQQPNSAQQQSIHHNQVKKPPQETPSVKPPPPPILTLSYDPQPRMRNAAGFIVSQNTNIEVTAQLDYNLTHGVISGRLARHLGLDIAFLPPTETIELLFKGERHVSDSFVVFEWGEYRHDLRDASLEVRY